ncbi:hypothetical protein Glove_350g26 [Diversispora epigaea]|uniref:Uncharacterized protein n=1 Tax=Diversispora epigaea TaxID=1348612 RepID=A0A397HHK8_9GLOM|nr:hypothetical protein Glove_350g26 [Diversispora epigaea]
MTVHKYYMILIIDYRWSRKPIDDSEMNLGRMWGRDNDREKELREIVELLREREDCNFINNFNSKNNINDNNNINSNDNINGSNGSNINGNYNIEEKVSKRDI